MDLFELFRQIICAFIPFWGFCYAYSRFICMLCVVAKPFLGVFVAHSTAIAGHSLFSTNISSVIAVDLIACIMILTFTYKNNIDI